MVLVYSTRSETPVHVSAAWQQAAKRCFIIMDSVISDPSKNNQRAGRCDVELARQSRATIVFALALND